MNHFAGIDRSVIRERNEGIRGEVQRLRLERQLRAYGRLRPGSGPSSPVSKIRLPLLRRSRIAD